MCKAVKYIARNVGKLEIEGNVYDSISDGGDNASVVILWRPVTHMNPHHIPATLIAQFFRDSVCEQEVNCLCGGQGVF